LSSRDSHGSAIDPRSSNDGEGRPLPKILRWFWIGSGIAFALMLLVSYVESLLGYPLGSRFPIGDVLFGDLLEFVPAFQKAQTGFFRSPAFSVIAYPPFGAVFYPLLYSFGHPVVFYLGVFALWLGIAIEGVRRRLIQYGINGPTALLFPLTVAAVSFPIAGLVQRGNIELFVWIFTAIGVWAFLRDRNQSAAVFWGLAAAMKLYPIVLLVLFVRRRGFKAFASGLAAFVIASVLSMAYVGPTVGIALERSVKNVSGYQNVRMSEWNVHEFSANHSAFTLIKLVVPKSRVTANLTNLYYLCGGLVLVALFFGKVRKMPPENQVLVITTFMVILPPISYFYTLVHLYAPFLTLLFLAIRAERKGLRIPGLTGTILLFVPIFAAFTIFTYPKVLLFGGLIQVLMLISLFLRAAQFPFSVEDGIRVKE
jgi:Glycosyltransferase family 87